MTKNSELTGSEALPGGSLPRLVAFDLYGTCPTPGCAILEAGRVPDMHPTLEAAMEVLKAQPTSLPRISGSDQA